MATADAENVVSFEHRSNHLLTSPFPLWSDGLIQKWRTTFVLLVEGICVIHFLAALDIHSENDALNVKRGSVALWLEGIYLSEERIWEEYGIAIENSPIQKKVNIGPRLSLLLFCALCVLLEPMSLGSPLQAIQHPPPRSDFYQTDVNPDHLDLFSAYPTKN